MNNKLEILTNILNKRLFDFQVLEFMPDIPGHETARIRVKREYCNKKFIIDHSFDDLLDPNTSNALFSDRAKRFIQEIADDVGIEIKFVYSQCITLNGDE